MKCFCWETWCYGFDDPYFLFYVNTVSFMHTKIHHATKQKAHDWPMRPRTRHTRKHVTWTTKKALSSITYTGKKESAGTKSLSQPQAALAKITAGLAEKPKLAHDAGR